EARRGRQRRAAGIFETLARSEHRLLAHHARPAHFLDPAAGVGDAPVAAAQLNGICAAILDLHVVCPDVIALVRRGLLLKVDRLHGYRDVACGLLMHAAPPAAAATSRQ